METQTLEEIAKKEQRNSSAFVKCVNYGCNKLVKAKDVKYIAKEAYCNHCYTNIMQED
ncbi:MAG: hypothetical protein ACP5OG_04275 [Candidatus Nanoarchaeia archaeon]